MEKTKKTKLILSLSAGLPALILLYHFLQPLVNYFTYNLLGLNPDSHFGTSVNFFFYDTIKILILLFVISSLMGVINAYFPIERLRVYLTTRKLFGLQYVFASFFGAITPFCSCSSIPLFIGFVKGGIPLGVTFAFLITSPLVNEVAVAMFLGLFGWKTTLIYAGSGIVMGIVGGFILGKFNLDRYLSPWVKELQASSEKEAENWEKEKTPFIDRLPAIIKEGWDIVSKVLIYVIIGIAIGAAMHGYVPENFFAKYLSADRWYAMPLAVLAGVPMYANAAGIIPIVSVLIEKGASLGTSLAFMMSVIGLSLPEIIILKKVLKLPLILTFVSVVAIGIMLVGYLFNFLL